MKYLKTICKTHDSAKNQSNPLKTRLKEVLLEMYIRLKYLRIYSYLRIKHISWFLVLWDICRRVLTQSLTHNLSLKNYAVTQVTYSEFYGGYQIQKGGGRL